MDHFVINKKDFQEARAKPPEVIMRNGGSGNFAAFLCVLCNWLLSIPYQSYCGDRACYNCLKLLAQNMKRSGCKTITCPGLGCGCGETIAPDQFFPDKAFTRDLNILHVACPNEGCSWEGKYSEYYEEHCHAVPCSEGHAVTDVQILQNPSYNGIYIWEVPELTRRRRDAVLGNITSLYSAPFFTSQYGYKLCLRVYLNGDGSGRGTHVSFFITLMKGEFDPLLPWPFKQTVSLSLLAQDGVSRDITQSFKPDEDSCSFQMPESEMNVASGCPQFCSLAVLENPSYARADTIYLKGAINLRGIEHIP